MTNVKKPNFLIIGAMKSATTSLYTYLKQHPDIFMTSIKEPMFFNNIERKKEYFLKGKQRQKNRTIEEYYKLFEKAHNETAIGEASPSYMYDKKCPEIIKNYLPDTKIIAVIRQPAERAYSNFLHARRADREPISVFKDAFNMEENRIAKNWSPLYHYKSQGLYYQQLRRYFNVFSEEKIKVILFEELVKDPKKITQEVFRFLNVDPTFNSDVSKKANVSGTPKGILGWIIMKLRKNDLIPKVEFSKILPEKVIKYILNKIYYKPEKIKEKTIKRITEENYKKDIQKLEKLISRNLSHWM